MAGEHVLIVDDERAIQTALKGVLEDEGYRVTTAGSGAEALRAVSEEAPDLIFLDIWMPKMDGLETLSEIKRVRPEATVVMISGHGTIETAVKATRLGAYDFIEKPLSLEKTLITVSRALEHGRLERENATLRERLQPHTEIIGTSEAIRTLREQIATAAPSSGRVLVHGENGSARSSWRAPCTPVGAAGGPLRGGQLRASPRSSSSTSSSGTRRAASRGGGAAARQVRGRRRWHALPREIGDMSVKTRPGSARSRGAILRARGRPRRGEGGRARDRRLQP